MLCHSTLVDLADYSSTDSVCVLHFMSLRVSVAPAPLDLCYVPGFDLRRDITVCPSERNVLNEFYYAAKGREWTESENWVLSQNDHCLWHGVTCNKEGLVVWLALSNNGLSGKLDSNISKLSSLEVLDLSDNDIKVCASCCVLTHLPWTTPHLIHMMLCLFGHSISIKCAT